MKKIDRFLYELEFRLGLVHNDNFAGGDLFWPALGLLFLLLMMLVIGIKKLIAKPKHK